MTSDTAIVVTVITGVFSVLTVVASAIAAVWARSAHRVGSDNAKELAVMSRRIDSRQDGMIRDAVKNYVRDNPGMIDSAVAHEAMRDLLFELVALHLSPEDVDQMRHDKQRRTGERYG